MLPSFLMVGTQRGGTTSLWRALEAHPAVLPPMFHKGVHYFDVGYWRGASWYRGHFPLRAPGRWRTRTIDGPAVTGESSGYYMHHPLAASRIAADLPDVRLVVILRDPVERAWSAYKHERQRGFESESFERALELEPRRLAGEVEKIRADPRYESLSHRHHSYVDRGQYAAQIEELFHLFGPDQVCVLDSETFFDAPAETFTELTDFLGLPRWLPAQFEHANARASDGMPELVRSRLEMHFEPYDERLEHLLGRPLAWRTRQ